MRLEISVSMYFVIQNCWKSYLEMMRQATSLAFNLSLWEKKPAFVIDQLQISPQFRPNFKMSFWTIGIRNIVLALGGVNGYS